MYHFWKTYLQPSKMPPSKDVMNVPPSNDVIRETTAEEKKVLSCSGCANTGMTWLAQCARQAMAEADIDSTLLEPATDPRNVAKAYEAVMAASPSSAKVAHLLRDLLVLTVCTNDGPWTNASIEDKMNELFDKQVSEVYNSFMAKVLHAYNTMHRAAQNSQEFEKAVNVFDNTCNESRENIRAAYIALYKRTPHWKSNTKRKGRPVRQAKPSHPMKKQLALDLAALHELADKLKTPETQKLVNQS